MEGGETTIRPTPEDEERPTPIEEESKDVFGNNEMYSRGAN